MADPAAAFHAAQDAALRGSAELAALWAPDVARIYSVVPQNAPLPFIRIGDDQVLEETTECVSASDLYATVHVWSKPDPPDVQLGRQIAGVIRDILTNQGMLIAGFDLVIATYVDTRHTTDPDGSSHAVLTFQYGLTALDG
jgi:hypothetical protein